MVPTSGAGLKVENVGALDELELRRLTSIHSRYGKFHSRCGSRGDLCRSYERCSGRCRRYCHGGSEARTRLDQRISRKKAPDGGALVLGGA